MRRREERRGEKRKEGVKGSKAGHGERRDEKNNLVT
jgi:hypothetical protein